MPHLLQSSVSASIVLYDSAPEQIRETIKSLLSSSLAVSLTVVDNSRDDILRSVVEDAGAEYIFNGKNVGFGAAHNIAIRKHMLQSEYHLVLNPDVVFGPETIAALYRFMNDNPDIGLVMPRIIYADGTEQRLCKLLPAPCDLIIRRFLQGGGHSLFSRRLENYELRGLDLSVPRQIPSLSGCFMFIRSSALQAVGIFDERYFMYMEDVDLCRRIGKRYETVFYPYACITHEYAKGSYRSARLLRYHMQSAVRYFSKWGWFSDPERQILNEKTAILIQSAIPPPQE